MRVLVLSPVPPCPPDSGWPHVVHADLRALASRGHDVTVLAVTDEDGPDPALVGDLAHAEYFPRRRSARWREVVAGLGHPLPFAVRRQVHPGLVARAGELVAGGGADVLLVEDVVMGPAGLRVAEATGVPAYLRGHNVSTVVCRRFAERARRSWVRWTARREARKYERLESRLLMRFDAVSEITATDAAAARRLAPGADITVVGAAVDLGRLLVVPPRDREDDVLVHVGSATPTTKLPALEWLVTHVLPRVRRRRPAARLELYGRIPPSRLTRRPPAGVRVHGRVDDVLPALGRGAVFVAPQFVGSGLRVKLLEAMATGNAIVATPVACEGLPVTPGRELLVAESEEEFAAAILRLLADPELRAELGRRARGTVEERYGLERLARELDACLDAAIRRSRSRGGRDARGAAPSASVAE